MLNGTDSIFFMCPREKNSSKKVAHVRLVSSIRSLKSEKYRLRFTIGGDNLDYNVIIASTPNTLETVKTHLNSTISTVNSRSVTLGINEH